jgi:hypothetical protein
MRLLFPIRPHVNALAATLATDRTPGRVLGLHPHFVGPLMPTACAHVRVLH